MLSLTNRHHRPRRHHHPQSGFTLIELLVVMIVISILIALLVPAVMGAFRRVRIASVRGEISQLESALGRFKANYGMDPPSSITLYETVAGWSGDANSRATIRQIWPQFNFGIARDINGDSVTGGGAITLSQGECLVFFLGGMCNTNSSPGAAITTISCRGFSKDPADPFSRIGSSREASLFEFLPARFSDVDGDGFPEYKDPLPGQTMPYLYYSSYGGQGYNAAEFGSGGLTMPYRQGTALTASLWKPNSFQIVSPGYDKSYGYGGPYLPAGTDRLPVDPPPAIPTAKQREPEADNITNFSEGQLVP